ncbi:hypothetical protein GQ44DRAFT_743260 [Phaeosphaeriaceae sp. PMI808]|nr:hypothetical protein GQ44DRAFT_743260 [Phaeosphaeriaceae sp. PMI808]
MQRGLDTIGSALASANEPPQYCIIGAGAFWAMRMGFRETAGFDILRQQNSKFGETALKSTFVKIGCKNFNVGVIPHPRAHLDEFPHEEYP